MQKYEEEMDYLVGDCVVGAAFLSYAGPFLSDYRDELVQETGVKQVRMIYLCIPLLYIELYVLQILSGSG